MLDAKRFEAQVKALCEERGTSIWEVSRKAGHARTWLWERFNGQTVEQSTVKQVARVLKVPAGFFFAPKGK